MQLLYTPKSLVRHYRRKYYENRRKFSDIDYRIESSRVPITTPKLLAISTMYSILSIPIGVLLGYIIASLIIQISGEMPTLGIFSNTEFTIDEQLLTISIAVATALILSILTRHLIVSYPKYVAAMRKGKIDSSLPHTVNVMLGMAKGGVPLISIFRFIAESEEVFEEISVEFRKIVEMVDVMGKDLSTAMLYVSRTTPSDKLRTFLENLVNIYEGGGDVVEFLRTNSSRYLAEKEKFYMVLFDILEIFAEFYLIIFIVAPLFLLTIIVVFRMLQSGALDLYKYVVYLFIPLGSVCMLYLLYLTVPREPGKIVRKYGVPEKFVGRIGNVKTRFRVDEKRRKINTIRNYLLAPIFLPIYSIGIKDILFYLLIPPLAYFLIFLGRLSYDVFVFGLIISASLPVVVFVEYKNAIIRRMERALPNFLRQMAALNEAGLNVVESLRLLTEFELGILGREISKVKREVEWGELLTKALRKVELRVKSPIFARVLSQVAKAMESTPSVSEALMTAAFYSEMEIEARDRIKSQMSVYTLIIYIAFFVFLFTSYVMLHNIFEIFGSVHTLPMGATMFSLDEIKGAFFETTMIIGAFSGLVAGMMGEGKIEAGFKHMLALVMVSFFFYRFIV